MSFGPSCGHCGCLLAILAPCFHPVSSFSRQWLGVLWWWWVVGVVSKCCVVNVSESTRSYDHSPDWKVGNRNTHDTVEMGTVLHGFGKLKPVPVPVHTRDRIVRVLPVPVSFPIHDHPRNFLKITSDHLISLLVLAHTYSHYDFQTISARFIQSFMYHSLNRQFQTKFQIVSNLLHL